MYQVIIVVHVLLGLGVIGFVLIQQGKGADAGAAFGSASSGSVFGAQGASSFLSRTTAILATLFFVTSLSLAVLSGYQETEADLMDNPDIENPFEDVPVVDSEPVGGGSAEDSVPVVQDLSSTISEAAQSAVEEVTQSATTEAIQSEVEALDQKIQKVIEETAIVEENQ